MKLQLIKEYEYNGEVLPIGSIIEIEDETVANELITSEVAILYTEMIEVEEQTEAIKSEAKKLKELEIETKSLTDKENKNMNMLGKAIKEAIETKAVTSYAGTEATQPLGIVSMDVGLAGACRKQPIKGNLNIVYSGTMATSGFAPVIDIVGEATAAATTAPLVQYSAIPAKWFATVAIPNEYLDVVVQMEAVVLAELSNKAALVIDNSILNGTFGGNSGLKGVLVSTDSIDTGSVVLSAIKISDLHAVVDSVLPECQANAMWVINPATWAQLKGSFLDADNLNGQLITDGATKTLLGYPVKVSVTVPAATPAVFGDFSKYFIGVAREMQIEVDRSVGFLTDVTAVKIAVRLAGGPACSKKLYGDPDAADTYGAFGYISA
jgi:HK97 family phage major capsid protein